MKKTISAAFALTLAASLLVGSQTVVRAEETNTFVYARPASTTSLDLHKEITENNAFAIDKIF